MSGIETARVWNELGYKVRCSQSKDNNLETIKILLFQEDRAWSFGLSLCMSLLGGMRMVSIEQLVEGLFQMIMSGSLGKLFDSCSRKTGKPIFSYNASL